MIHDNLDKVKLFMGCTQLKTNPDIKIDSLIRVYYEDNNQWTLAGQTDLLKGCNDPKFEAPVSVNFMFGFQQNLIFEVLDFSNSESPELIGVARSTLGKIVSAQKHFLLEDIQDKEGREAGKLIIQRQRDGEAKRSVQWQWSGVKLANTDGLFDKSDPYLKFYKERAPGDFVAVHETEVIMNNLNPVWKPFHLMALDLADNDDKLIKVECWDWEKKKKHQFIGDCEITLAQLSSGQTEFQLNNPKKKKPGKLRVLNFAFQEESGFLDYILGGQGLKMFIGMSFSSSMSVFGGFQNSSHNMDYTFNEFQNAMLGVSQVALEYDHDQTVPMYGFGGIPRFPMMNSGSMSNCFPCTGNPNQPRAMGLDGILSTYANAIQNVELGSMTNIAPLLKEVMQFSQIQKKIANGVYTMLLVLTSSDAQDLQQVINCLVEASQLPLSVMFVGIGDDAFTNMEKINAGKELTDSSGKKTQRELAHFVAFRNFKGDIRLFAQYILDKVPDQFTEYMKLVGRKPNPLLKADLSSIQNSHRTTQSRQSWSPAPHDASFAHTGSEGLNMRKKMNTCVPCMPMTMQTMPVKSATTMLMAGSSEIESNGQSSEMEINVQGISILTGSVEEKESQTIHRYSIEPYPMYTPVEGMTGRSPLSELQFGGVNNGNDLMLMDNKNVHPQIYPTFENERIYE